MPPAVMSRALFFATLAHLLAAGGPLPVPALGTGGSEGGAALESLSWQRLSRAVVQRGPPQVQEALDGSPVPPSLSAPLFKRWERGDEVSHSLKIACKTSCSVGPCADSSAPVPGSLCEKPPPSPPGWGEQDGAGWQCLGAALPKHDVAVGGYTSPCLNALTPGPAARNRIWEGLSKAPWLQELRSCSFSPLLPGARVPSVCTHPVLCPHIVPCHGWAQQQGEEGAWVSSIRAVPGGSQLCSISCRARSGLLLCWALPAPFFGC